MKKSVVRDVGIQAESCFNGEQDLPVVTSAMAKKIMNFTPQPFIIFDIAGSIQLCNPFFLTLVNHSEKFIKGKNFFKMLTPHFTGDSWIKFISPHSRKQQFSGNLKLKHHSLPVLWTINWDDEDQVYFCSGELLHQEPARIIKDNPYPDATSENHLLLEQTIFEMNMRPETSMKEVAHHLLSGIERLYPGALCSILKLHDDSTLHHYSAPSLPEAYINIINGGKVGPAAGSCGTAVATNRVVIVSNIEKDPLWADYRDIANTFNLRACWSVPIYNSKGLILGTFATYHNYPKVPSAAMLKYIQRWAQLIGILMENNEMIQQLAMERAARQRQIIKSTIAVQETERKEIGHELHDNVNQILSAAKLYMESISDAGVWEEGYRNKSIGLLMKAIEEIRKISKSLVPPRLDDLGMVRSVNELIDNINHIQLLNIEFTHEGVDENTLDHGLQLSLYRIIQEQVANIVKHAGASHAMIHIKQQDNDVFLTITDNGIGFDPCLHRKGIGLTNIKNRSAAYQGKVAITSSLGNGCVLNVELHQPLAE